jgi:hypothetical protein
MAGTSPAMTPRKWFNMSGIRYSQLLPLLLLDKFHATSIHNETLIGECAVAHELSQLRFSRPFPYCTEPALITFA